MKKIYIIIPLLVILIVFLGVRSQKTYENYSVLPTLETSNQSSSFSAYLNTHKNDYIKTAIEIPLLEENESYDWVDNTTITKTLSVPTTGLYSVRYRYVASEFTHIPATMSVSINGEIPYYEASQITVKTLWAEENETLLTDRYGNDISPLQTVVAQSQDVILQDSEYLFDQLYFYLEAGENDLSFTIQNGSISLEQITLFTTLSIPSYDTYKSMHTNDNTNIYFEKIEAEDYLYKNSSSIVRGVARDPLVLPFSLTDNKLNILERDSYSLSGDAVTWLPAITEAGWYDVVFKVKQDTDFRSMYRSLYVNNELPFEEAQHLVFTYSNDWQNMSLKGFENEEYQVYLEPGDVITLEVDSSVYQAVLEQLEYLVSELTALSLDVTRLTKNNIDPSIDWNINEYFPTLDADLTKWIRIIDECNAYLLSLNGYEKSSKIVQDLVVAQNKIKQVQADIDELPRLSSIITTGSSSALQIISGHIDSISTQALDIDALYITNDMEQVPNAEANWFARKWISVKRFFLSFSSQEEDKDDQAIEVWVNRSRQNVDVLQQIIDQSFTEETGIPVTVSIINDDSKLLLSNSANQQPDVALGVSAWIPNEYGMRGMLYDLTQADGFEETISVYHEEQLVPMIYDDALYGLPETENFYVMFYRKDIIVDELGLEIPDTWEDVVDMLPALNRYGMSFYVPLSNSSAFKSFDTTAPFIYQFGGSIYSEDGTGVALDTPESLEAMQFMTDLYTEYGTPVQTTSFFNGFRYGTVPIGIGDYGMYLQLLNAASDIRGLWEIALVPGVESTVTLEDNTTVTTINRSMPGAQQSAVIFDKSEKKEEAWEFLQWWMSTETQVEYSETLLNSLGSKYLWNSANIEAFSQLRIEKTHNDVILAQWEFLKETQKIPGSYIIEREISNVWNAVVYDDANLRSQMMDSIIKIEKELQRKMMEFEYVDANGTILKEFILPTSETVRKWVEDNE